MMCIKLNKLSKGQSKAPIENTDNKKVIFLGNIIIILEEASRPSTTTRNIVSNIQLTDDLAAPFVFITAYRQVTPLPLQRCLSTGRRFSKMTAIFEPFCSANSYPYCPAAQQLPKTIYIFACVASVIISVLSTLGNTTILFALQKCQSRHPLSKVLLCSFVLDGFVGLVALSPFSAYYGITVSQPSRVEGHLPL